MSGDTLHLAKVETLARAESKELAFLRYFYDAAGDAFGPADSDIYDGIMDAYEQDTGEPVPAGYRHDYEEDEEEEE